MPLDVLISPGSGLISFINVLDTTIASVVIDDDILHIFPAVSSGGLRLGGNSTNIFVGDGTTETGIIFEQDGFITADVGKNLTLGQVDSGLLVASTDFLFTNGTLIGEYDETANPSDFNSDLATFTGGANAGTLLRSRIGGHFVVALTSNDNADSFIVGSFTANDMPTLSSAPDQLLMRLDRQGILTLGGYGVGVLTTDSNGVVSDSGTLPVTLGGTGNSTAPTTDKFIVYDGSKYDASAYDSTSFARLADNEVVVGTWTFNQPINASISGNAATSTIANTATYATSASQLSTPRTLTFTNHVTGSKSFNGSADISITMTLAATGVTPGSYNTVTVDAYGRITAGTTSGGSLSDADTLDGLNSTQFLRADVNATKTAGYLLFAPAGTSSFLRGAESGGKQMFAVATKDNSTWFSFGSYFDGANWKQQNSGVTGKASILRVFPGSGALWYSASGSSEGDNVSSWNVANGVTLWDEAGLWNATKLTGTIPSGNLTGTYAISISGTAATATLATTATKATTADKLTNHVTFSLSGIINSADYLTDGSSNVTINTLIDNDWIDWRYFTRKYQTPGLNADPYFEDFFNAWTSVLQSPDTVDISVGGGAVGNNKLSAYGTTQVDVFSTPFPINVRSYYKFRYQFHKSHSGANQPIRFYARFLDSSGNPILTSGSPDWFFAAAVVPTAITPNWESITYTAGFVSGQACTIAIPSNATFMQICSRMHAYGFTGNNELGEAVVWEFEPASDLLLNGTVTGTLIANNTINDDNLIAGSYPKITGVGTLANLTVTNTIVGNVDTATKLKTARSIALTGNVTAAGVNFDGSGNISLTTVLAAIPAISGVNLTALNATSLTTGTVPNARLSGSYTGINEIALTGQFTSTLVTGTPPIVVASTTVVPNLNAGMLEGNAASAFALAGHTHSGLGYLVDPVSNALSFLRVNSGATAYEAVTPADALTALGAVGKTTDSTITGDVTFSSSLGQTEVFINSINTSVVSNLYFTKVGVKHWNIIHDSNGKTAGTHTNYNLKLSSYGDTGDFIVDVFSATRTGVVTFAFAPYVSTNVIWHKGNDGAASGLDADLLDGQHGSYYRSAANINAGTLPTARLTGTYTIDIAGNATTATTASSATTANAWSVARTVSFGTGDVSGSFSIDGSANVSNVALTLASVGTAGTYKSVTTDVHGRVTAGTNPTTLSGFGITDGLVSNFEVASGQGWHYRLGNATEHFYSTGAATGTLKIVLPKTWTNNYIQVHIRLFNAANNSSSLLIVTGYNNTSTTWENVSAVIVGNNAASRAVRLAHDGTKCVILLGTTSTVWNHTRLLIESITVANGTSSGWETGWSYSVLANETGITDIATPTVNSGIDADTLDSYSSADFLRKAETAALSGIPSFNNGLVVGSSSLTPTGELIVNVTSDIAAIRFYDTGTLWTINVNNVGNANTFNIDRYNEAGGLLYSLLSVRSGLAWMRSDGIIYEPNSSTNGGLTVNYSLGTQFTAVSNPGYTAAFRSLYADAGLLVDNYTTPALARLRSANGTHTAPTIVNTTNYLLGGLYFDGYLSAAYVNTAAIKTFTSENWATNYGSYMTFSTVLTGTTTLTEHLRITGSGNVLIGTTTDSGPKLSVNGTISGTQLISTVASGTAPLSVSSTTVVPNLNASRLEGNAASAFQMVDAEITAIAGLVSAADRLPYFTGIGTAALATFTSFGRSLVDDADASAARVTLGLVIGTDVQAYDAESSALMGLTSAADALPYFTGVGTASITTLTAYARTLLDDANATTARTTLGLALGVNVQAYDAELAAIAGLTSAADALPYFTGIGTASTTTLTTFGRSLIDDADATAARVTLGLVIGTNVQAYDAELAALAGLTSAADALPYFTGIGTASTTTLTTFGRSLIDDADASAARTTLGLVIGTNVQAYDAELAAIAGLTSVADRLPYFTGSGTAALATFTTFGRSLVDDIDTATAQATLGLVIGTNVQAYDAELAAIAGLVSVADRLPYFTGSGTAALATFSSFGRTLVDDADASTARTTLGLVIGTNVQAYDAELAAIAGLTSVADRVPYFTGSGTAALATFSSFGRTLVDDVDASTARTTLGLATIASSASASDLSAGTLPDARLSGLYTGVGLKLDGTKTIFNTSSSGSSSSLGRDIINLAQFRSSLTTTGAIVFIAPTNAFNIMMQFTLNGLLYTPVSTVDVVVQGYRSGDGTSWVNTGKLSRGSVDVQVRLGRDSGGKTVIVLGDVGTVWESPHISIVRALFSHTNVADAYCYGWTTALLTDLTGYTLTSDLDNIGSVIAGATGPTTDAELNAIAGLTSAADSLPYFTGLGTATLATLTSFGRTLIDDVDASTARTTLGLVIGTNVQAYDAELAAIAGLVSVADRVPYFTGSGTAALATLTSFGRTLIDDVDASTARTTLGLVIGTNVQAYDAELAAIAGLTSVADRVPYFTGSGTAALATFTTYGRSLVDDVDASTARTTLGLVAVASSGSASDLSAGTLAVARGGTGLGSTPTNGQLLIGNGTNYTLAAITGTANQLVVTNGAGSITLSLPQNIHTAATPTFAGLTITNNVTSADPVSDTHLTNKQWVEARSPKNSVRVATTAALTVSATTSTLTNAGALAALTIDGVAMVLNDRVLVKNQATTAQNGIYTVTTVGSVAVTWVLTRATDGDTWADLIGAETSVEEGTSNADSGWFSAINSGGTLGTTAIVWQPTFNLLSAALIGVTGAADKLIYLTSTTAATTTTLTTFGRSLIDDADATAGRVTLGLVIGTNVQAYDAELAAIAGLTSAADALPYFTGIGTASTTTLTSYIRGLLDDANAAAAQTTLGLVIGTNVQAYDAELAAIAGLTSVADRLPYFTGSGTAALATFTTYGRSLVDDADASTARTTLGLATVASSASASDITTGTLADARLPTSMATKTFTGTTTLAAMAISGAVTLTGTSSTPILIKTSDNASNAPYIRIQGRRSDANASSSFSGQLVLEAIRTDALAASTKVIGNIIFGTNIDLIDTMAYAASISAVTDDTIVDATNMPISLSFRTGIAGSALASNISYGTERMKIGSDGKITMLANIASSSTTTGTLVVTGGVGISEDLYVAATIYGTYLYVAHNDDGQVTIGSSGFNGNIELGKLARTNSGTPYIDFHSSAASPDYDTRIIASGGTASSGAGTLSIHAATLALSGALTVSSTIVTTSTITVGTSGNTLALARGSVSANAASITTAGTGVLSFIGNGSEQFRVSPIASAVNLIQVAGSTTTTAPSFRAIGSDTNIGMTLYTKNAGNMNFVKYNDSVTISVYAFLNVGGLTSDTSGAYWRGFQLYSPTITMSAVAENPILSMYGEYNSYTDPSTRNFWIRFHSTSTHTMVISNTSNGDIYLATSTGGVNNDRLHITSTGSVGIGTATPDRLFHIESNVAATNTVTQALRLTSLSTGTPATGIGVGIEFEVETAANNNEVGGTLELVTTDVTAASEDFDLVVKLMAAGATAAEVARFKSTGGFDVPGVITVGITTGTAPFTISSTTVVTNLNADLLDGQHGSYYQTADAELTAIAGLTSVADRVPYFTGSGTAALATFTTYGRSLVDDVDASTARTTLGLVAVASSGSASDLSAGTLADARLPTSMATKTFTGTTTLAAMDINGAVTLDGGLSLDNGTSNLIQWETAGISAPTFTARSAGAKLVLYPNMSVASVDYGLGIESGALWFAVGATSNAYKWYGGTTLALSLTGTGALTAVSSVTATAFIPNNATIPTNGLYYPATNILGFSVNTTAALRLSSSALYPVVNNTITLGASSLGYAGAYFASGSVLYFNNSDVTLTHSANNLTLAGGTLNLWSYDATLQSTINGSGTAISSIAGLMLGIAAADGVNSGVLLDARGSWPRLVFRSANGTSVTPTATLSGDILGSLEGRGYDGISLTVGHANIDFAAAQNWSGVARGGKILFKTTANGATSGAVVRMTLENGGALLIGTTTDDGTNKLRVAGGITVDTGNSYKVNNVAVLGARKTGWAAATGTATRTTFDTATITLEQLAQRTKAIIDDFISHGAIGT